MAYVAFVIAAVPCKVGNASPARSAAEIRSQRKTAKRGQHVHYGPTRGQAVKKYCQYFFLAGFLFLEACCVLLHARVFGAGGKPFLPLLLTSVYCTIGVSWVWAEMWWAYRSSL